MCLPLDTHGWGKCPGRESREPLLQLQVRAAVWMVMSTQMQAPSELNTRVAAMYLGMHNYQSLSWGRKHRDGQVDPCLRSYRSLGAVSSIESLYYYRDWDVHRMPISEPVISQQVDPLIAFNIYWKIKWQTSRIYLHVLFCHCWSLHSSCKVINILLQNTLPGCIPPSGKEISDRGSEFETVSCRPTRELRLILSYSACLHWMRKFISDWKPAISDAVTKMS